MKKCTYFKKSEIEGLSALTDQLETADIGKIAKKLKYSYTITNKYASNDEKHKDIKVPMDFIAAAREIVRKKKEDSQSVKAIINEVTNN